jgi:2-polyprenyl-3-methyl-5-hydroxy-6-metoxy-1,4-benzoquinol methylase
MVHYNECPVCAGNATAFFLPVTDYSSSGKKFEVWQCPDCTVCFTQDAPGEDEIAPFYQFEDYISHTDTKKGLVHRLYHIVRNITLNSKKKIIKKATGLTTGRILDIGCGTGAFLHTMKKSGWEVTGLEPDETARKNCLGNYGITARLPDELFSLPAQSFDAITMWHVLEHVHQLQPYIKQMYQLLKPGGVLIIAVPNYTSYDARVYKNFWAAWDVPRHLYHFSPVAMKRLLGAHQFQTGKTSPMWFDSFYVSMLSEKYRKGNIVRAMFTGFISNMKAFFNREKCSSIVYRATRV